MQSLNHSGEICGAACSKFINTNTKTKYMEEAHEECVPPLCDQAMGTKRGQ